MLRNCLRPAAALALLTAGVTAGLLMPRRPTWPGLTLWREETSVVGGSGGGAAAAHGHAGPTLEQVRGLAALTVLAVDVADVQVTDLRGYTGGARAALVVKGDLTLATDLSEARFASVDAAARTAVLVLPPPRVAGPRVDHTRTRLVWVWRYGLWQVAPGGGDGAQATVVNRAFAEAQRVVAAAGADPALDARARAQAEAVLRAFGEATGWTLTVRWSDRPPPDDGGATTRSAG